MSQRSTGRRGTPAKRFLQIIASLVLATVGWFLLGEPEELTAAETERSSQKVVARFDGHAVTEDEVMTAAAGELVELEKQRRELISKTARQMVAQRLIEAEADRRGVTSEELIEREGYAALASRLEREHGVEYAIDVAAAGLEEPAAAGS